MDDSGDWIWSRIRQLALVYARLPAPPPEQTIQQDVQHVIAETLGRDIDRRLVAFYVRELHQMMNDAGTRRAIRDETEFTAPTSSGVLERNTQARERKPKNIR